MARYGQCGITQINDNIFSPPIFVETWRKDPTRIADTAQDNVGPNPTITTLLHLDQFFGAPGQGPNYDYPNPRGYRQQSVVYGLTNNTQFQLGFLASIPALAFSSDAATVTCTASDSPSGQQWSGPGYMAKYEIDTSIQLRGVFMNPLAGVPIDPTLVQLFVMDPNGNVTDYSGSVIREAVGRYHLVIEPGLPGTWTYKWQGSGAAAATSPDTIFTVAPSLFLT
jgi:hypothetical protein